MHTVKLIFLSGEKYEIFYRSGTHTLALHDLTGFNARCDAIYFTTSSNKPSDDISEIDKLRKRLNWKEIQTCSEEYDLIVAGGGVAGICTALSALRSGVRVLLICDRGVLGGCNSSEIRVCMGGITNLPPYPNIGNVVKEIAPVMGAPTLFSAKYYEDNRKLFAFEASGGNYSIAFNECVTDVETSGSSITSVITTHTLTGAKKRYSAKLFSDCTGVKAFRSVCNVRTRS